MASILDVERSVGTVSLDRTDNPFAPSLAVFEALAGNAPPIDPAVMTTEIAGMIGVPGHQVFLTNGLDELIESILLLWQQAGPAVVFPPTLDQFAARAAIHGTSVVSIQRRATFDLNLDLDLLADLPPVSLAYVMSPNEPTGSLLDLPDAIRLARACSLLVIDERHSNYAGRSLVPLSREFDNIVVLQTLETWAGLRAFPLAYAVAQRTFLRRLRAVVATTEIAQGALVAAAATLRDLPNVRAGVRNLRQERSRMFRMLRKLNMVTPVPSWSNFLLMRIERGTRDQVSLGLRERHLIAHEPPQLGLERYLRVSAGYPEHTDSLRKALIAIGTEL